MKGFRVAALLLTLGSCVVTPQICHSQNETAGTTVTYQVTPNVYTCGDQGTAAMNCLGIPFSEGGAPAGTVWLYASYNVYTGKPYIWAVFNGANPLAGSTSPGAYEDLGNEWGFSPAQVSTHTGYPYGYTSFPCEEHMAPVYQNGAIVEETLPNCSTFTGTVSGITTAGQSFTAQVSIYFWCYHACGGRTCTESAIVTGGTVSVTYQ